jgi:hypothetical protein
VPGSRVPGPPEIVNLLFFVDKVQPGDCERPL